jgi:hypothetical protein
VFTFEIEETKALMSEIVAEMGEDHVNIPVDGTCMYFDFYTKEPSCGLGHLFARKGMTSDMLTRYENTSAIGSLCSHRDDLMEMSESALDFLRTFQSAQDNGVPWGQALDYALQTDPMYYED